MEIKISDKTYARLAELATGFDTVDNVINRLIDKVSNQPVTKPEIIFEPKDENNFKAQLLNTKKAEVRLYTGEHRFIYLWSANKLTKDSNLRSNLGSGYLRNWQKKGIKKIELKVLSSSANEGIASIASALGLTYSETDLLNPKKYRENDDYYVITFNNEDENLINKIKLKVNSDGEVRVPSHMLD